MPSPTLAREIAEAEAEAPSLSREDLMAAVWSGHEDGCSVCDIYRRELERREAADA